MSRYILVASLLFATLVVLAAVVSQPPGDLRKVRASAGRPCEKMLRARELVLGATWRDDNAYNASIKRLRELDPGGKVMIPLFVQDLVSNDECRVNIARDVLKQYQHQSVPFLLALIGDRRQMLRVGCNGAPVRISEYDINYIGLRAAELLEDITWQDFGYPTSGTRSDEFDRKWEVANLAAQNWWTNVGATWTRLTLLREFLNSDDPVRQSDGCALFWTSIDGLTPEWCERELDARIRFLADSSVETVRVRAIRLLEQKLGNRRWWLDKQLPDIGAENENVDASCYIIAYRNGLGYKFGLRTGDVVVSINGRPFDCRHDLVMEILVITGDFADVTLMVVRNHASVKITIPWLAINSFGV